MPAAHPWLQCQGSEPSLHPRSSSSSSSSSSARGSSRRAPTRWPRVARLLPLLLVLGACCCRPGVALEAVLEASLQAPETAPGRHPGSCSGPGSCDDEVVDGTTVTDVSAAPISVVFGGSSAAHGAGGGDSTSGAFSGGHGADMDADDRWRFSGDDAGEAEEDGWSSSGGGGLAGQRREMAMSYATVKNTWSYCTTATGTCSSCAANTPCKTADTFGSNAQTCRLPASMAGGVPLTSLCRTPFNDNVITLGVTGNVTTTTYQTITSAAGVRSVASTTTTSTVQIGNLTVFRTTDSYLIVTLQMACPYIMYARRVLQTGGDNSNRVTLAYNNQVFSIWLKPYDTSGGGLAYYSCYSWLHHMQGLPSACSVATVKVVATAMAFRMYAQSNGQCTSGDSVGTAALSPILSYVSVAPASVMSPPPGTAAPPPLAPNPPSPLSPPPASPPPPTGSQLCVCAVTADIDTGCGWPNTALNFRLANGTDTLYTSCPAGPQYNASTGDITFSTCFNYNCLPTSMLNQPFVVTTSSGGVTNLTGFPAGQAYVLLGAVPSTSLTASITMYPWNSDYYPVVLSTDGVTSVPAGGIQNVTITINVPVTANDETVTLMLVSTPSTVAANPAVSGGYSCSCAARADASSGLCVAPLVPVQVQLAQSSTVDLINCADPTYYDPYLTHLTVAACWRFACLPDSFSHSSFSSSFTNSTRHYLDYMPIGAYSSVVTAASGNGTAAVTLTTPSNATVNSTSHLVTNTQSSALMLTTAGGIAGVSAFFNMGSGQSDDAFTSVILSASGAASPPPPMVNGSVCACPLPAVMGMCTSTATILVNITLVLNSSAVYQQCVPGPSYDVFEREMDFSICWRYACMPPSFYGQGFYVTSQNVTSRNITRLWSGLYKLTLSVPAHGPTANVTLTTVGRVNASATATTYAVTFSGTLGATAGTTRNITVPVVGLSTVSYGLYVPARFGLDGLSASFRMAVYANTYPPSPPYPPIPPPSAPYVVGDAAQFTIAKFSAWFSVGSVNKSMTPYLLNATNNGTVTVVTPGTFLTIPSLTTTFDALPDCSTASVQAFINTIGKLMGHGGPAAISAVCRYVNVDSVLLDARRRDMLGVSGPRRGMLGLAGQPLGPAPLSSEKRRGRGGEEGRTSGGGGGGSGEEMVLSEREEPVGRPDNEESDRHSDMRSHGRVTRARRLKASSMVGCSIYPSIQIDTTIPVFTKDRTAASTLAAFTSAVNKQKWSSTMCVSSLNDTITTVAVQITHLVDIKGVHNGTINATSMCAGSVPMFQHGLGLWGGVGSSGVELINCTILLIAPPVHYRTNGIIVAAVMGATILLLVASIIACIVRSHARAHRAQMGIFIRVSAIEGVAKDAPMLEMAANATTLRLEQESALVEQHGTYSHFKSGPNSTHVYHGGRTIRAGRIGFS